MADWLIDFKRRYPGIVLDVVFENRIEDLLRDEVDIAIRVIPEPPQNLGGARDRPGALRGLRLARLRGEHPLPVQLDGLHGAPVVTAAVIGRQLRVSAYQGEIRREVVLEPTLISGRTSCSCARPSSRGWASAGARARGGRGRAPRRGADHARRLAAVDLRHPDVHALHAEPPSTRAIRTFIDYTLERVREVSPGS